MIKVSFSFWEYFALGQHQNPHNFPNVRDTNPYQMLSYNCAPMLKNVTQTLIKRNS